MQWFKAKKDEWMKERQEISQLRAEERKKQALETARYKEQVKAEAKRARYARVLEEEKIKAERKRQYIKEGGFPNLLGKGFKATVKGVDTLTKNYDKNKKKVSNFKTPPICNYKW